jgi:hypothetical protein
VAAVKDTVRPRGLNGSAAAGISDSLVKIAFVFTASIDGSTNLKGKIPPGVITRIDV